MCSKPALLLICMPIMLGNIIKEQCHDILSHFINSLDYGQSVGKPKNNNLLRKKNTKGVILKQKGTMMAEDGED